MFLELNHIGGSRGMPPTIIELKIVSDSSVIKEDVLDFRTNKVPDALISNLKNILYDLEAHNEMIDEQ